MLAFKNIKSNFKFLNLYRICTLPPKIHNTIIEDKELENFNSENLKDEFPSLRKAIEANDLESVNLLIGHYDPYDLRQSVVRRDSTKDDPNVVPSDKESRIIGCICETASDAINWMEIVKYEPRKCYCGNWFRVVGFEEILNLYKYNKNP